MSFSIFSVSCAKFWFTGFAFFLPFLVAGKSDFSFPSFSNLQQSQVFCVVYVPPCFLCRLQFFSKQTFLGTLAAELVPGGFFPFLPLLEDFSKDSGLAYL